MKLKPKYSFRIPNCILEDDLPPSALLLLIHLFKHSSNDGGVSMGYDQIKRETGITSRTTISENLKLLRKNGWFHVVTKGGNKNTTYWLRIPPRMLGMDVKLLPGKIIKIA